MGIKTSEIKSHIDIYREFPTAIECWLNFKDIASSSVGIQENSINQPIRDVLGFRRGYVAEFEKPIIVKPSFCTERELDLWVEETVNPNDNKKQEFLSKQEYFFEFKMAQVCLKKQEGSQDVFDDLLRLALISYNNPNAKCYFLVFGDVMTFNNSFREYVWHKKMGKDSPNEILCEGNKLSPWPIFENELISSLVDIGRDKLTELSDFSKNEYGKVVDKACKVAKLSKRGREKKIKELFQIIVDELKKTLFIESHVLTSRSETKKRKPEYSKWFSFDLKDKKTTIQLDKEKKKVWIFENDYFYGIKKKNIEREEAKKRRDAKGQIKVPFCDVCTELEYITPEPSRYIVAMWRVSTNEKKEGNPISNDVSPTLTSVIAKDNDSANLSPDSN